MATKLPPVDIVIVGMGWTGGILAKELAEAGLKVVALERGTMRSTESDYSLPNIRDELRYVVRHDLMQNTARDTITVRNNPSSTSSRAASSSLSNGLPYVFLQCALVAAMPARYRSAGVSGSW